MFAPTSITIAVVSGIVAGAIFYWVMRLLARRQARPVPPQNADMAAAAAINQRHRAAADAATARLIKALQGRD